MPIAAYLAGIAPPNAAILRAFLPITWERIASVYYLDGAEGHFERFDVDPDRTVLRWGGLTWEVDLFASNGAKITENWITRTLVPDCRLLAPTGGRGRVVDHVFLKLYPAFRLQRLAGRLHVRECGAYQEWGAREIQLRAAWEGLRDGIWLRMGFRLTAEDLAWLNVEWARAAESLGEDAKRCVPIPDRFADWNEPLRSWFKQTTDGMTLDMYKVLERVEAHP